MAKWKDLERELGLWDQPASLWWRDDDAVAASPQLDRLVSLAREYDIPLQLAVIPAKLDESLVERLGGEKLVWVCQHGFDHENNAQQGERKIELGGRQNPDDLLKKLATGRNKLKAVFSGHYLDILVPPWNRIDPKLVSRLSSMGFRRLSVLGARPWKAGEFSQLNVHLDIIDWKRRAFVGCGVALEGLIFHLHARRTGHLEKSEPTGIMTHHLVQDEDCWKFLRDFFIFVRSQEKLSWVGGPQLLTV